MRIIKLKKSLFLFMLVGFMSWLGAQTVSGTVSDEFGPVANLEVRAVNAGVSTFTDFDGKFMLEGVQGDDTLEFISTSGSVVKEAVNNRTVIDKVISESSTLDELVVIGFGAIKKEDATGAVDVIKADEFNKGTTTSADQLLQGKIAGVQVTTNSGQPGSGSQVRIRGNNAIRTGNVPLYVIDGVPFDTNANTAGANDATIGSSAPLNPLNFINNADIESMTVLKDASATAIYGARAANGVILITTKKGTKTKPMMNFNSAFSAASVNRPLDLLGSRAYRAANPDQDKGSSVNPFKDITRTGTTRDLQFSLRGGDSNSAYRLSLGNIDQQGLLKNSEMAKYNVGTFLSQSVFNDVVDLSVNFNFAQVNNGYAPNSGTVGAEGNLLTSTYAWNPTKSFYNEDGTYLQESDNQRNPLALLDYFTSRSKATRMFGNFTADVNLTRGFTYKFLFGADYTQTNYQTAMSRLLNVNNVYNRGYASFQNQEFWNRYFENTITYQGDITSSINLQATLGTTYEKRIRNGQRNIVHDFLGADLDNQDDYLENQFLGQTRLFNEQVSLGQTPLALNSYFLRTIFNVSDKYLLTATLRTDGSSRFGADNRYGFFPSFSAAWKLNKESFFPTSFSEAKLRLGWGKTGNQEFPIDAAQLKYIPTYSDAGNVEYFLQQVGNPELQWESTDQINIGFDFGIKKLTGSIDWYHKKTKNLLYEIYLPGPVSQNAYQWQNVKDYIVNTGFEIAMNYQIKNTGDFIWNAGINMAFLKNEIVGNGGRFDVGDFVQTGAVSGQGLSGQFAQVMHAGYAMNTFYLQKFEGFDANGEPILTDPEFLGNPNPTFNLGFNTSVNYKNWDFILNGYGNFNFYVFNNTANALFYKNALVRGNNVTENVVDNGEADNAPIQASSRFLEKGNFFRFANVTLGYTLGDNLLGNINWINSMRLYVTASNLFVITNYNGYDPEVNINKEIGGVPSFGMDFSAYPRPRTWTFGLNVNF